MAKMVTAYDTRTGAPLPEPVPQAWLDKGIFPYLSATEPTEGAVAVSVPVDEPNDTWSVEQLRAHAETRGIDLGGATRKADILTAVTQTPKEA